MSYVLNAVTVETDGTIGEQTVDADVGVYQKMVGGYVDTVYLGERGEVVLAAVIVNTETKHRTGLDLNHLAASLIEAQHGRARFPVRGRVVIVGSGAGGECDAPAWVLAKLRQLTSDDIVAKERALYAAAALESRTDES